MKITARVGMALAVSCLGLVPGALAQETRTRILEGAAQLPTSGLIIDLPAKPGIEYHVSGSWSLTDDEIFDTRDVVDEIDLASGNVRLGNWVLSGYFNAGSCVETVNATKLDDAWSQSATLWGETWDVRGGTFTFDGALGRRPAVLLCRTNADGASLLLYHFLADQPETLGRSSAFASAAASELLASASDSFSTVRAGAVAPLRLTNVRNRGTRPAARTVTLPTFLLEVDLPDDGYLWLVDEGDNVDFLQRLLPTYPNVDIELVLTPGAGCTAVLDTLQTGRVPDAGPLGLPPGWIAGPGLDVEGEREVIMCHPIGEGGLVVGSFQGSQRSVDNLHPILGALLAAARKD